VSVRGDPYGSASGRRTRVARAAAGPPVSRRKFLKLTSGALAAGILDNGVAAERAPAIGVLVPNRTGPDPLQVSPNQVVGEAARMGAILAEEELARGTGGWSSDVIVLLASAPDDASTIRSARRLLALGDVFALVGGFSPGQSRSLAALAEESDVLFLNIACSSDALREGSCGPNTFHVEASATMYLDCLLNRPGPPGARRWFVIHPDSDEGRGRHGSASAALERAGPGSQAVGHAVVGERERDLSEVLKEIEVTRPDAVLLLADALGQLDFLARFRAAGFTTELFGFPEATSQTRMFYDASRRTATRPGWAVRAALWEATLEQHGAKALNQNFLSRWGRPMDPSAWAAYQAIAILSQLAARADSLQAAELRTRLESPETKFDVGKGAAVGFRKPDHQLLQPLYRVHIAAEAQGLMGLARLGSVTDAASRFPPNGCERRADQG
jgi:ABC-type branched-subunit amino acid transport system substrate-binding protein